MCLTCCMMVNIVGICFQDSNRANSYLIGTGLTYRNRNDATNLRSRNSGGVYSIYYSRFKNFSKPKI